MSALVWDRRRSQRPWTRRAAGLAVAAWLGLAACSPAPEAVPAAPKLPAVTVGAVAQRAGPVYGQYVGQTEAAQNVQGPPRGEGFIGRQAGAHRAAVQARGPALRNQPPAL